MSDLFTSADVSATRPGFDDRRDGADQDDGERPSNRSAESTRRSTSSEPIHPSTRAATRRR